MSGLLAGLRVLDFTQVLAGPFCTSVLGSLGAEIIKVESWRRLDGRGKRFASRPERSEVPSPKRFVVNNANKRSLAIDISSPDGRDAILRVASKCDVVIEAFRPGVMRRLGLSVEEFQSRNPSLVIVSISGNGNFGPDATHASYAGIFCALGGLSFLTGYSDGIPTEYRGSGDLRVGWQALIAVLGGLIQRDATGRGTWIDLAGREAIAGLVGDAYLAAQVRGESPGPEGNDDGIAAPCGCFRSSVPEEWVAFAIRTNDEWSGCCAALNSAALLHDERFADQYLRWKNRDVLNPIVAECLAGLPGEAAVTLLQQHGVAAALSATAEQVFRDPQLLSREFLVRIGDESPDAVIVPRNPWIGGDAWHVPPSPPPSFGNDTDTVLEHIAGYSPQEIAQLWEAGVLG